MNMGTSLLCTPIGYFFTIPNGIKNIAIVKFLHFGFFNENIYFKFVLIHLNYFYHICINLITYVHI